MTLNERRVTPPGPFWGATRRDGAFFRRSVLPLAYGLGVHRTHGALIGEKMASVAVIKLV